MEKEEVKELEAIAKKLSAVSRGYVLASARAAEFGEMVIRQQYGLTDPPPKGVA
jgi:hypothetical protein